MVKIQQNTGISVPKQQYPHGVDREEEGPLCCSNHFVIILMMAMIIALSLGYFIGFHYQFLFRLTLSLSVLPITVLRPIGQ